MKFYGEEYLSHASRTVHTLQYYISPHVYCAANISLGTLKEFPTPVTGDHPS